MFHTETEIYPSLLPLVQLILGTTDVRMHLLGVLGYSLLACWLDKAMRSMAVHTWVENTSNDTIVYKTQRGATRIVVLK